MQIQKTSNYGKFVVSAFNRDTNKTHRLEESMQKHGWLDAYPMHVRRLRNGKLEIIAGHHRFAVAQKLNIPVKYVEVKQKVSIQELERATNSWSTTDWLISHVRTGKEDYVALMELHKRTGINISQCVSMLSGYSYGGYIMDIFKNGTFKVSEMIHANVVADIIILCKNLGIKFARDKSFVAAISKIVFAEGFNIERLKKKITKHQELMTKQANMKGYIDMLDTVFNRSTRDKIPLAFNTEEAAKQRSAPRPGPTTHNRTNAAAFVIID